MKFQEYLPVAISVLVIILVAIVQKQSKLAAGVTATMPVTIPLALWIVYNSSKGNQAEVVQFTNGMINGIISTIAFVFAIWVGSRLGLKLGSLIGLGYIAWGLTLAVVLVIRKATGS